MSDTTATDVGSATETPPQENAATELKSTDTGVLSALKSQQETDTATPSPADATSEGEKPDSNADPADKGNDADSAAEHREDDERDDDDRKLEPWMRKRLKRAEERGRKQASAELLELIKSLGLKPEQAQQPTQAGAQATGDETPQTPKTLADFDYDVEKYTAYQAREAVKAALAERDQEVERRKAEAAAEEARQVFEKRKAEFEKRVGKGAWGEIVTAEVDVPQEVVDLLMGHPRDLDIAYYLVKHPDEIENLRGKPKLELARGLAAIEAKLSGKEGEELPPKTTKAPPPPPKVPSGIKAVKSIEDMTTEERIAEWRRQRQQRRQA